MNILQAAPAVVSQHRAADCYRGCLNSAFSRRRAVHGRRAGAHQVRVRYPSVLNMVRAAADTTSMSILMSRSRPKPKEGAVDQ